jgi:LemA protein
MGLLWLWILLGVIGLIVLIILIALPSNYNGLTKAKLKVENNLSQIQIQTKKRFDLIPNLVETVKGYAKHESQTLTNVIAARNAGMGATNVKELAKQNNELSGALGRLFAVAEGYPQLQANTNFINLQNELSGIEQTIASARGFYNDAVMMYNRKVQLFPSNIFARIFHFTKEEFFEATAEEQANVKVQF